MNRDIPEICEIPKYMNRDIQDQILTLSESLSLDTDELVDVVAPSSFILAAAALLNFAFFGARDAV